MPEVKLTILDPVLTRVDRGASKISPCLSYQAHYYKQGRYRKERVSYTKRLIHNGHLWTGLVHRTIDYCKARGISIEAEDRSDRMLWKSLIPIPLSRVQMKGISFRPDQIRLIEEAIEKGRGVIQAPTGSGKTALAIGIVKSYPSAKALFLCHTKTLVDQTAEMFRDEGLRVSTVVEGEVDLSGGVVIATYQTFRKIKDKSLEKMFQVVIVDESHHLSSFSVTYAEILSKLLAPIRIGLTATVPTNTESVLAMEAFLGPVIGKLTIEEGVDLGILAEPRVRLMRVPNRIDVTEIRRYSDIYDRCIVHNDVRNRAIIRTARGLVSEGKSVLIIVTKIEHGNVLMGLGRDTGSLTDPSFIRGETEREARVELQRALQEKQLKCVIATAVWKEGVDIPSLDCVINAAGGKSEIATLQAIGRGLRTTKDKKEVLIVDYADPYRYLAEHFVQRLSIYIENGWI